MAEARALAALVGIAGIERIIVGRVGVDGDEQHVVARS
jgi:hypothetical protein